MVEHFPDRLGPEDYHRLAADRSRASASGVGAAVAEADNGSGTWRWVVVVSDGERADEVQVDAPDVAAHRGVPPEAVALAVERRAERYAPGARWDELVANHPLSLTGSELADAARAVLDEGP